MASAEGGGGSAQPMSRGWLKAALLALGLTVGGTVTYFTTGVGGPALDLQTQVTVPAAPANTYVRYFTSNGNMWQEYSNGFCQQVGSSITLPLSTAQGGTGSTAAANAAYGVVVAGSDGQLRGDIFQTYLGTGVLSLNRASGTQVVSGLTLDGTCIVPAADVPAMVGAGALTDVTSPLQPSSATKTAGQTDPLGGTGAILIAEDSSIYQHLAYVWPSPSGLSWIFTAICKSNGRNVELRASNLDQSIIGTAAFDLSSGQIFTTTGPATASISSLGNGWYLCTLKYTGALGQIRITLCNNTGSTSYQGDNASGAYIYLPQYASNGTAGIVPAPVGGQQASFLRGDGTWGTQLTINPQAGTGGSAYTLAAADANNALVNMTAAAAATVLVPANTFVAGTVINIVGTGTGGVVTITGTGGMTASSTGATATAPVLRVQYSSASVIILTGTTCLVLGDVK